jgi:hypothetical protein
MKITFTGFTERDLGVVALPVTRPASNGMGSHAGLPLRRPDAVSSRSRVPRSGDDAMNITFTRFTERDLGVVALPVTRPAPNGMGDRWSALRRRAIIPSRGAAVAVDHAPIKMGG